MHMADVGKNMLRSGSLADMGDTLRGTSTHGSIGGASILKFGSNFINSKFDHLTGRQSWGTFP